MYSSTKWGSEGKLLVVFTVNAHKNVRSYGMVRASYEIMVLTLL